MPAAIPFTAAETSLAAARLTLRNAFPGIEGIYVALCLAVTGAVLASDHQTLVVAGILAFHSCAMWLLFLHLVRRRMSAPLARLTVQVGDIGVEAGALVSSPGRSGQLTDLEDAVRDMGRRVKFEFRTLIENSVLGVAILRDGHLRFANRAAANLLGYDRAEALVILPSIFDLLPEAGRTRADRLCAKLQAQPGAHARLTLPLPAPDGGTRWVQLHLQQVEWRGHPGLMASLTDISHQKRMEEELRHLATYDSLTGAVNRRYFLDHAAVEIDRSRRHGHSLALLSIDLDHFKAINDTHGHAAGDLALKQVTRTVLRHLREIDVLARIGGEEFAVLLPETTLEGAMVIAERLRDRIEGLIVRVGTDVLPLSASIGVADSVGHYDETIAEALKRADIALYRAKLEGRNRVVIGSPPRPLFAGDGI